MRFIALDVETANPDMSSICQIGIVHFENGQPVETWSSLVDPQDYFDGMNVSIHELNGPGSNFFVHTESEHEIRIISFRKASQREAQIYFHEIKN